MIKDESLWVALAYDIAKVLSGGRTTDDSPYAIRQILDWVKSAYADWLKLELKTSAENGRSINPMLLKRESCVGVERLEKGDCPCDPKGGLMFRVKLPKIVSFLGEPRIAYVGAVGFQRPFRAATVATAVDVAQMRNRFSEPLPSWFVMGSYLYVVTPAGDGLLEGIALAYLPEDPTESATALNGTKPYRLNLFKIKNPYPNEAVSWIRTKVIAREGFWTKQTEPTRDENNNANAK